MKHFWNWIRNEDTGQRELWFEGVIASESGKRGSERIPGHETGFRRPALATS